MPRIQYTDGMTFYAVRQLRDPASGKPTTGLIANHWRVELVFESDAAGATATAMPDSADVQATLDRLREWCGRYMADKDLSGLRINPTATNVAWYLTEVLGPQRPPELTAVRVTVDQDATYSCWFEQDRQPQP